MIPIIARELNAMLRSWRAVALQIGFLACLGVLVILRWPSEGRVDMGGVASRQVFRIFGYGLLIGLMLVSPAFPATSIVRERLQGTLALLLNSPIRPISLVLGKLAGSIGFVVVLIVLTFPAAAACFAMGGIQLTEQLGGLYLVLLLLAVEYAAIGLLVSSIVRSTDAALRMTYAVILVLAVGAMAPHFLLKDVAWAGSELLGVARGISSLSPFPAVLHVLGDTGVLGGNASVPEVLRFAIGAALVTLLCVVVTTLRLSSRPMDRARDAGRITDDRSARARFVRRIMYLWFFDPQRRSGLIAPWQNPVMVKEQRCRPMGRANWMMRLIGTYFVLSLLLVLGATTLSQSAGVTGVLSAIAIMQVSLIVLLAPSLASGLISAERESKGWQLLQMTPLSPGTIVMGKLLSAFVPLALVMLATLPAYIALLVLDPAQLRTAVSIQITLVIFAIMTVFLSAGMGSLFRQTAAATAIAYSVIALVCLGTLFIWLGRDAPFTPVFVERVLTPNPLATTLSIIGTPGFAEYRLIPSNWYAMAAITLASGALMLLQVARLGRAR
jgi:ABC-type transport system involved in multi-copper enzyme maturation permease subunit